MSSVKLVRFGGVSTNEEPKRHSKKSLELVIVNGLSSFAERLGDGVSESDRLG